MAEPVEPELVSDLSGILRRIFVDYLNVPFWFRASLKGRLKKSLKEYEKTDVLWRDLLGAAYRSYLPRIRTPTIRVGDSVTLREVDLTNFLPRAPGKLFASGYGLFKNAQTGGYFAASPTASDFVIDRERAFELAKSATGIRGFREARISSERFRREPFWGVYIATETRIVSVIVNAKTGSVRIDYDSAKLDQRFIGSLSKGNLLCRSGWSGVIRFGRHANRLILTAYGGIPPRSMPAVERGFPLILSSQAYKKIQDTIENYGSVFLESVTGIIEELPHENQMERNGVPVREWPPDVPRIGLRVDSRLLLKNPGTPRRTRAGAWTAVKWRGDPYYLHDRFEIGVQDYEALIEESVSKIRLKLDTLRSAPLFDFDERVPRFYEAQYGPNYFLKRAGIM